MTLKQLLETLKTNNVKVIVQDLQGNDVCKIYAESVDALDDALESRTVNRWQITSASSIEVVLNE
jgi:hypothetical protein